MNEPTQSIFEQVLLRHVEPDVPGPALLTWRADAGEHLVQVYVNGRLADVTQRPDQRELWVHLDRAGAARVELIAVDPRDRWRDNASRLAGWTPKHVHAAVLRFARDEALPIETRVTIDVDGERHTVEPLWRAADHRGGFGALFGVGEFGRDAATGVGLGLGEFGAGGFGWDGAAWRWRDERLSPGEHVIDCRMTDAHGRTVAQLAQPARVVIDAPPVVAGDPAIDDQLHLTWTR